MHHATTLAAIAIAPALTVATTTGADAPSAQATKPNVLIILADDLGYGDVQCLNPLRGKIPTPNLDKLATQGMVFTDAHGSSAVCTPTRYGLLTGRYNWRTRLQRGVMQDNQPPLISADRLTVAKLLKQQKYQTICIGKWHLGYQYAGVTETPQSSQRPVAWPPLGTIIPDGPVTRGFDQYYGYHHAGSMHALVQDDRVIAKIKPIEMLPRLAKRAVEFIGERATGQQPFFLYLPLNSPHEPIVPTKEWQGNSGLNAYADYVMQTDAAVGDVLAALDMHKLTDNTLIIVTSDNGCSFVANVTQLEKYGHYPSAFFRGYKTDIWDGGHRVPFIVRWPRQITPGTRCNQLICLNDIMATCADILGAKLPAAAGEDSVSFLPLLRGNDKPVRETLVHHSYKGNFAIREGQWKLILCPGSGGGSSGPKTPSVQLYDLSVDEGERKNLQAEHPEIVKRLTEKLEKIVASGRSTPGEPQKNDVGVDIFKKNQ